MRLVNSHSTCLRGLYYCTGTKRKSIPQIGMGGPGLPASPVPNYQTGFGVYLQGRGEGITGVIIWLIGVINPKP